MLRDNDIQVLTILLKKKNDVVARRDLLLSVWRSDNEMKFGNLLDSSISRIKKAFKKYPEIDVKNIYSKGYVISELEYILKKQRKKIGYNTEFML